MNPRTIAVVVFGTLVLFWFLRNQGGVVQHSHEHVHSADHVSATASSAASTDREAALRTRIAVLESELADALGALAQLRMDVANAPPCVPPVNESKPAAAAVAPAASESGCDKELALLKQERLDRIEIFKRFHWYARHLLPPKFSASQHMKVDLTTFRTEAEARPRVIHPVYSDQFGMLAHNLQAHGETTIREVFDWLLGDQKRCAASEPHGKDGLVLDVGLNEGGFTLMSTAYGCRVVGVEPQSHCVRNLLLSLLINPGLHVPTIHQAIASDTDITFHEDSRAEGCAGWSGFPPGVLGDANQGAAEYRVAVKSLKVADIVDEDVLIYHMDVEGAEIRALRSSLPLFKKRKVAHLIFEITPDRWKGHKITVEEGIATIKEVIALQGYTCRTTLWFGKQVEKGTTPRFSEIPVQSDIDGFVRGLHAQGAQGTDDMWCTAEKLP